MFYFSPFSQDKKKYIFLSFFYVLKQAYLLVSVTKRTYLRDFVKKIKGKEQIENIIMAFNVIHLFLRVKGSRLFHVRLRIKKTALLWVQKIYLIYIFCNKKK